MPDLDAICYDYASFILAHRLYDGIKLKGRKRQWQNLSGLS